ncbi:MAG TPA: GAF domain-containing sensor histidine kinase [Vicinamibacterales bacterium]|jgi:signal transduction histidine kinase|nr:GAF domain-containing sensor histidine kinase [Vicinamibacterales bacterium]
MPKPNAAPSSVGIETSDLVEPKNRIVVSAEPLSDPSRKRPRPQETLIAVSKALGSRLELSEVLRQTTAELARALRADIGSLWRLTPRDSSLEPIATYRLPTKFNLGNLSAAIVSNRFIATAVRASGEPVYSSRSARDPRFDCAPLSLLPHRSVLIQPLRVRGMAAGMFVFVWTRKSHRFNEMELRLVEAVTTQAGMAVENAELVTQVRQFSEQLERRVLTRTERLKEAYDILRSSREELRVLSAHLERVREAERARIARAIHDELGQALTGLKIDLAGWSSSIHGDQASRPADRVDAMIETVRRIASELRPSVLDDLGLVPALEWQLRDFQARTGVKCRLRSLGPLREVHPEHATAIFRIFLETLTNVARHAAATHVQATIRFGKSAVRLDVRDNGKGMPETSSHSAPRHARLGILGMQERAAIFGGRVTITSRRLKGTIVRVRIPFAVTHRLPAASSHTDRR